MAEPGTLYVVGTPIGNLGDISPRALKILEEVDFIAAEDTRVSGGLLAHFGLKKQLVSYYEHNLRQRGDQIMQRISSGESCAIVTDAGMPCISDPGEDLVRLCADAGIRTVVVPGPSAVVAALAVSGLPTGRFAFEGFLSVNKGSRKKHLLQLAKDPRTLIFYEAPHKLLHTLQDMLEAWGNRRISLARELTKMYEEVRRTTLEHAVDYYKINTPKGEFVLIIEGAPTVEQSNLSFSDAVEMICEQVAKGTALSAAAKEISHLSGYKKGELYKAVLEMQEAQQPDQ